MNKTFNKPARTVDSLIDLTEERGLAIDNREKATKFFRYAGYYRLSGYMLPFQLKSNGGASHEFVNGVALDDIIDLYVFDRKLRLVVMDAVERIEVAIRSVISDTMSVAHGPHWFLEEGNFKPSFDHAKFMEKLPVIVAEVGEHQTFIKHYLSKYTEPECPPSWMLFEIMDFGTASKIYSSVLLEHQKEIAEHFGVHYKILTSWVHTISSLRNICAHHSRLWNRVFGVSPKRLKKLIEHFEPNDRFYSQAVAIKVLLDKISGHTLWAGRLKQLFEDFPKIPKHHMGFPDGWEKTDLWSGI